MRSKLKINLIIASTLTGSTLVSAASPKAKNKTEQRPNIIFIMSDDHAYQAISAYNDRFKDVAPTPNIDRIAELGMRFDRCLVTNSISGPSRACILTGKYSHLNGFVSNEQTEFNGEQQTFPKLLQQAGYQTAIIGKWHLGSTPTGFNYWDILSGQGQYYNPEFSNSKGKYHVTGYVSNIITEKTLNFLKSTKKSGKPFMLMMHHKAPHRPWEPNIKYLNAFKDVVFPLPETLFDDYSGRGLAEHQQDMTIENTMKLDWDLKMLQNPDTANWSYKHGRGRYTPDQAKAWDAYYEPIINDFYSRKLIGRELVLWKYQRYMNDYLACIKSVDESVGRVLDYLKKNGLDKNTIVVYTSDQGFYLGEHGWFDKRFMHEESYRTPLLWYWPGVTKAGSVNKGMVSNLDFGETFLDAAGVKIPAEMQGVSMKPVLAEKTPGNWRKEHYYHYYAFPDVHSVKRHYGVSTERYKLMHFYYNIDEWELFDLKTDPQEMKNVYNEPAYASIRAIMHQKLDSIRTVYKDNDEVTKHFLPKKK